MNLVKEKRTFNSLHVTVGVNGKRKDELRNSCSDSKYSIKLFPDLNEFL